MGCMLGLANHYGPKLVQAFAARILYPEEQLAFVYFIQAPSLTWLAAQAFAVHLQVDVEYFNHGSPLIVKF
jgi:hypothetical protein